MFFYTSVREILVRLCACNLLVLLLLLQSVQIQLNFSTYLRRSVLSVGPIFYEFDFIHH